MSGSSEDKISQKNKALVKRIYAGALNPSDYNDLFRAWDEHFDAVVEHDEKKQSADFEWTDELVSHFEQAGWLFDKILQQSRRSLQDRIDDFRYAVILCSVEGRIVHFNKHAKVFFEQENPSTLFELLLEPNGLRAINKLMKRANCDKSAAQERQVLKIHDVDGKTFHLFLAEIVGSFDRNVDDGGKYIMLRAVTATWDDRVSRALASAFQLTNAEVELVSALYNGLSIKEVARWKRRSQATLRTQLSSVLQKTNTRNQADLSRIISGLVQVLAQEVTNIPLRHRRASPGNKSTQRSRLIQLKNGYEMEFVESGDLQGTPFYFIQTSTQPTLTKKIVKGLKRRGIRLISPNRPGVGGTTRTPISLSPSNWAKCHLEAMQELNIEPRFLGGHCSGGVYALELAKLSGTACENVLLVDVGAPLRNAAMINQMPSAPKRLFLAARFFPPAIRMPYKLVTSDFYSGRDGEERLVNYFFEGSPVDEAIVNEGHNWQVTRDNIDYCLQNPAQIAQDVTHWSRDNSGVLSSVVAHSHVRYFHGEANFVHQADNIRQLARCLPNISYNIVPDRGQLLIYVEEEMFVNEIARICGV